MTQKSFSVAVKKNNNFLFCEIYDYKNCKTTYFSYRLFVVVGTGSGLEKNQDPGSRIPDPGSIPDSQPWSEQYYLLLLWAKSFNFNLDEKW